MQAAASPSVLCVRLLLEAGADPHYTTKSGYRALDHAVSFSDNKEILYCLITTGVDLEWRSPWGSTPLVRAITSNHITSAKILLDCGAEVNSLDSENDTPLLHSLYFRHDDITELLLRRGASYTLPTSFGGSVLHLAAMAGGLRTLEILHGAALRGIDTEATDKQGETALRIAQKREGKEEGFLEKFQELIVDIRTRNAVQTRDPTCGNNGTATNQLRTEPEETFQISRLFKTVFAFLWSTLREVRNPHTKNSLRLDWSMVISILIYWALGLGWAGFIYVTFFGPGRTGQDQ